MKNYYKVSTIILLMSALSACSVKSTNSTTTSGTSPIATPTPTSTAGGSTTTGGISCDGVNNNTGSTKCYYKNLPTIQVMGATASAISSGTPFWSSRTNLGSSVSQNQFTTDEVFNLRIIPRMAIKTNPAANPSVPGKTCNHLMTKIATKLYIQVKLQTKEEDMAGSSDGEVATLSASIDEASKVWHFSKRVTSSNLVLKVVNVLTDSRCQQGGTGYCPYSDLPLNAPTATYPTECVAFDLQYSTDETLDLPGVSAN